MDEPAEGWAEQSRVFAEMTPVQRQAILAEAVPRRLERRAILERQGDPARTFYVVVSGYLKLTQVTASGDEVVVRFVGPGEPYGGVVALDQETYPVTAQAVEAVTALGWSREVMRRLVDVAPQLRMNILAEITRHMRDALQRVQQLQTTRVPQRLAATLLMLAQPVGRTLSIAHPITRQELAEMTGATLFTISRTLADWEARGLVSTVSSRIHLLQPARLEHLADDADGGGLA